jgi:hypothetical protein
MLKLVLETGPQKKGDVRIWPGAKPHAPVRAEYFTDRKKQMLESTLWRYRLPIGAIAEA